MDDEVERGVRAHGGAADAERRECLRNQLEFGFGFGLGLGLGLG